MILSFIGYFMSCSGLFLLFVGASSSDSDFPLFISGSLTLLGLLVFLFGVFTLATKD